MHVGFFFWPFTPDLVRGMAASAERYGYDLIGIADTPGNAMDPWVAATLVAEATEQVRIALCVSNLETRHPAVSAAAAASVDLLAPGRAILGIGAGHSGTRNIGMPRSGLRDLMAGASFIRDLLSGRLASWRGGEARLPWVQRACPLFLAASGPRALRAAGRSADGVFVNYGLLPDNLARSEQIVRAAAAEAGRTASEVEIWHIAALDCRRDAGASRRRVGAILAFMAGGYILAGDLTVRGVPPELHAAVLELRRRYSTRPGDADAALVDELGLFDYLSRRFAVFGTPEMCRDQLVAAREAGVEQIMFSVSLAADPLETVRLFGQEVLPQLR